MDDIHDVDLTHSLFEVRKAIRDAALSQGRDADAVTLVAASKTVSPDRLERAIRLGQCTFGENRVQEAKEKWPSIRDCYPQIKLHLVGGLQSNKARDAIALFDAIQSVDRQNLAQALAVESQRQGRCPEIYIQVNTGREDQKNGAPVEGIDDFINVCRQSYQLDVVGLMCIPPADCDPSSDFALLGAIAARNGLGLLSMGMSSDFKQAIAHGATHVRIGSAIFGSRPTTAVFSL